MTRRAEAISSDLARVALWNWNHLGLAVSLSTLMLPWRSSGDSSDTAFGIPPDPAAIALLPPTDPVLASWPDG